jgi:signal peptidase I
MIRRLYKIATITIIAVVVTLWAVTLRPQALGGPATFVAVRGSSMVPTYQHGDLVVVESVATYEVGQVVAYRVPAGEVGAGHVVIHRIVAGDSAHGFTMKGDNNTAPDPRMPKQADMVGIASFRVANAGRLVSLVQQPVFMGGLASAIVVTVLLAQPPRQRRRRRDATRPAGVLTTEMVDP